MGRDTTMRKSTNVWATHEALQGAAVLGSPRGLRKTKPYPKLGLKLFREIAWRRRSRPHSRTSARSAPRLRLSGPRSDSLGGLGRGGL